MPALHICDLIQTWSADPRIPLSLDARSGNYSLKLARGNRLCFVYCPFCGEKLRGAEKPRERSLARQGPSVCKHLQELARVRGSPIKFRLPEKEFWLCGRDSHDVRLFYCPICGIPLLLQSGTGKFQSKPHAEIAALRSSLRGIATIDQAVARLGPPDVNRGPIRDYFYLRGKRTRIGYRRALFYEHLAETVTVIITESLQGRFRISLMPKAAEGEGQTQNLDSGE